MVDVLSLNSGIITLEEAHYVVFKQSELFDLFILVVCAPNGKVFHLLSIIIRLLQIYEECVEHSMPFIVF